MIVEPNPCCNFVWCLQADALAFGKGEIELRSENVPDSLIPHKTFTGNRPSMSILLPELNAYSLGQLLSMYENRIAVQVRAPDCCFPLWFWSIRAARTRTASRCRCVREALTLSCAWS